MAQGSAGDTLKPLRDPISSIKGIGPQARLALRRLLGVPGDEAVLCQDMLFHLPFSYLDRSPVSGLPAVRDGELATLCVRVGRHHPAPPSRRRIPYRVLAETGGEAMTLVFFNARGPWLEQQLPEGHERIVSGRMTHGTQGWQMVHPDWILRPEEAARLPKLEPVYPLTEGVSSRMLQRWMDEVLARIPELPEWIDEAHLAREGWPGFAGAIRRLHRPASLAEVGVENVAMHRLAYDELLAYQLSLALIRRRARRRATEPITADRLPEALIAALPFTLTGGQHETWQEIRDDLGSGKRMLRLLQGDVGSGKTVLALLAMLAAAESGGQSVLMAPTELLAQQHARSLSRLLEPLGMQAALLTGSVKGAERARVLEGLASGEMTIVVGTHAIFQESVAFRNLRLAVIDEQHRFGVQQRLQLSEKGPDTHILLMSATPIPRSLALTAFGDMDVSSLREKPAGRQEIATAVIPKSREEEVLAAIKRALGDGQKVYWICPLVEESETGLELAAAQSRYREFTARFGAERVGLVHGRMPGPERDAVMRRFADGGHDLLVATTVVEVGVDVPEATIIVIEQAERFGLSQLHQLRGRVGRGSKPSSCILLYEDSAGDVARERLRAIRGSQDGFEIAEADLQLRGSGELLGTRQSGLPQFHFADLSKHTGLVLTARDDTRYLLDRDPDLSSPRGQAIRLLLLLFKQGEKLKYLKGG